MKFTGPFPQLGTGPVFSSARMSPVIPAAKAVFTAVIGHPLTKGTALVASILSLDTFNKGLATVVGLLTITYWVIKIRKETRGK